MAVRTYRDLEGYRESYSTALAVSRLTKSFPRLEQVELARQLRKAARSVPANIVEGWAKRASTAEFKRYLQVAIGSCDEARMWLELSKDEGYISEQECTELKGRFNRIGAMLQGLWKQWRSAAR
ncbi:MAG: four helix bundle protein [Terriglobia bacterium]